MNSKLARLFFAGTLAFCASQHAMAAFVIDGTRVIFDGDKKNTSFQVTNQSDRNYGGQVWISNTSQPEGRVYMVPSPSFFKVTSKGTQVVRIMHVNNTLPADRESLFKLNVQEIPPMPEKNADGSAMLALAMNTQLKLFWRPKGLSAGRQNAEDKITIERHDGKVWLKNPTPYYFAIIAIKSDGKKKTLSDPRAEELTAFKPFSEVDTGLTELGGKVSVDSIDDWGGIKNYALK